MPVALAVAAVVVSDQAVVPEIKLLRAEPLPIKIMAALLIIITHILAVAAAARRALLGPQPIHLVLSVVQELLTVLADQQYIMEPAAVDLVAVEVLLVAQEEQVVVEQLEVEQATPASLDLFLLRELQVMVEVVRIKMLPALVLEGG